jgi:hypothetical protein
LSLSFMGIAPLRCSNLDGAGRDAANAFDGHRLGLSPVCHFARWALASLKTIENDAASNA